MLSHAVLCLVRDPPAWLRGMHFHPVMIAELLLLDGQDQGKVKAQDQDAVQAALPTACRPHRPREFPNTAKQPRACRFDARFNGSPAASPFVSRHAEPSTAQC